MTTSNNEMDTSEATAIHLEQEQSKRWIEYGKGLSFWALPEEKAATYEIRALKKMSASYQRRHGWLKDGLGD